MKGLFLGVALASISFVAASHASDVSRLIGSEQGLQRVTPHGHGPAAPKPSPSPVCNNVCTTGTIGNTPPCCPVG